MASKDMRRVVVEERITGSIGGLGAPSVNTDI